MSRHIYLDYASATPLDERVFSVMKPYLIDEFYNPSASYEPARKVRSALEGAKSTLAGLISAKRDEIVMTAGATESIFIAVHGVMEEGDSIAFSAVEHPSVRTIAKTFTHDEIPANPKGIITPESVRNTITDQTKLVSITYADSELGTVQNLRSIAVVVDEIKRDRIARGIDRPLYFHSDASQAISALDLNVSRLGVDMLTLNASKCGGPKQVGLLWVSPRVRIKPILVGGGQERGLRSGTENTAGAVGFARALELTAGRRHEENDRLSKLRRKLVDGLQSAIPEIVVNGHEKKHLPGHINVSLDGLDAERVVFHLDLKGVYIATGSACSANKGTRSSVLTGVGMSDSLADGSLRMTMGSQTTSDEIEQALPLIITAIQTESKL